MFEIIKTVIEDHEATKKSIMTQCINKLRLRTDLKQIKATEARYTAPGDKRTPWNGGLGFLDRDLLIVPHSTGLTLYQIVAQEDGEAVTETKGNNYDRIA